MARNYGVRYVTIDQFLSYCSSLGVRASSHELEHYEKTGTMLPVARVIYPDDYVIIEARLSMGLLKKPPRQDKWPEILRLSDKLRILPERYADLHDAELIDSFDREMGKNPYLVRPTQETYRHWDSYRVLVPHPDGQHHQRSTVRHYYGYWQAHQLYFIQQYPDLYENRFLLDSIPDEIKRRTLRPQMPSEERLREFNGMASTFDALSFWINMYTRERDRTFALICAEHGVRQLDNAQSQAYRTRLEADAKFVRDRYDLTVDNLYGSLQQLLELHEEYQRDERFRLANEIRNDILYEAQFIQQITGEEWNAVADELGKRSTVWTMRHFRHLDIRIRERDEAYELISHIAKGYTEALVKLKIPSLKGVFSAAEIDEFLDFCQSEGLSVMITAFSGMIATDHDYGEKFRPVSRYTNLRNAVTALEFLLKLLAEKGGLTLEKSTLYYAIRSVMKNQGWRSLFVEKTRNGATSAKDTTEFFVKLSGLLRDTDLVKSEEAHWARVFLVASLARNLTVHTFPVDDWFYGDAFGDMLEATVYAVLYSWQVAKLEGLV